MVRVVDVLRTAKGQHHSLGWFQNGSVHLFDFLLLLSQAFKRLESAKVNLTALLNDPKSLTSVLMYHVVPNAALSRSALKLKQNRVLSTMNGQNISIVR